MNPSSLHSNPAGIPWAKQPLGRLLRETDTFVTCVELVTSRGVITERSGRRVLDLARGLAQHPRVHALSITDNPGGNAMLSADTLGTDLIARGQEVIIHLSCKDWNRNALQSRGWKLASEGFNNILALSGDCPTGGYAGQASGVFDIDSVGLLQMYSDMNLGLTADGRSEAPMEPTRFFLGAVVTNFKRHEREVMPQYFKLAMKVRSGAQFIINQIGYDSRKQDELLKAMSHYRLRVPALANVYVLSRSAARFFNSGAIPGVVVTDELLSLVEKQAKSPDKGKTFFLEFAAKQCAVARGLGYRGVYLGGHLKLEQYARVLSIADSFAENDWKDFAKEIRFPQKDEFYLFDGNPETGLSSTEINPSYLASKTPEALSAPGLRFPSSSDLPVAARRVFLEACKCPSGEEVRPRPLTIFDKKSQSQVRVASLGEGLYEVTLETDGEKASRRSAAIAAGIVKLSGGSLVEGYSQQVAFPNGQSIDALVGLLLVRALNVRAVVRAEEAAASRGVLSAPSAQND